MIRNGMGFPNLPDMNKHLNFQSQTIWDEPGVGGGGYVPPTPPPSDPPKPTIDEIKMKIIKGDIESALEDLNTLGATNIKETDEKDDSGNVIGKTIEFTYGGIKYSWTYFTSQGNSGSNTDNNDNGDDNNGGDTPPGDTPGGDTPGGGDNPVVPSRRGGVTASAQLSNQVVVKLDEPFVGPVSPDKPDEPDKPIDNIFEIMDLNDIPGYGENKGVSVKIDDKYNSYGSIDKIEKEAKNLLKQYKNNFKEYACALLGNEFASEYSSFYDGVLKDFVGTYEFILCGNGTKWAFKTKDLVDGFLTKLDEAIKAKIPPKTEE